MMIETKSWKKVFVDMFLNDNPEKKMEGRQRLNLDDESLIYICKLWDGIFVWGNDVHSRHISYPYDGTDQHPFTVINVCHEGRCEIEMQDDIYIYMTPGLLNVNNRVPKDGYHYPTGSYEGLEIAFDMTVLKEHMPVELTSFGLTLEELEDFLERGNGNCTAHVSDAAMQQSKVLYENLKAGGGCITDYRFWTVSILYYLKNGEMSEVKNRSLITKGQRRIAIEAEQILTENFRRHYTVEELSRRYGVSPSALKKYFEAVFGLPVSYYVREKKMNKAKQMLSTTCTSVGEIAAECGYENQGKFGSAFKTYTGVSPLEYRRRHKIIREE